MTNSNSYFMMKSGLRHENGPRQIAKTLGRNINEVIGALIFVCDFALNYLPADNGRIHPCGVDDIDRLTEIPGFAVAMEQAGYLVLGQDWVEFTNLKDLCIRQG